MPRNYSYSAPGFWQICYEANVFIIATKSLRHNNPPPSPVHHSTSSDQQDKVERAFGKSGKTCVASHTAAAPVQGLALTKRRRNGGGWASNTRPEARCTRV